MLERLGRFAVRRRVFVLVGTLIGIAIAGILGGGVVGKLSSGGFSNPNSESARAAAILHDRFGAASPNFILLVTARRGSVDTPAVAARGVALTRALAAEPGIEQAVSYWTL